jgi:catechol 2,3-dioxygenase-like lactoylglutathione lyase family enzyme
MAIFRVEKGEPMTTSLRFDHIIIAVRDLDAAIADYATLGFAVYYGGRHTHKATHNGLISLADGSYLELLAPVDPADVDGTIASLAEGEGFAGYALLSGAIDADAARLQAAGLVADDPSDGHRDRYDGARVRWRALNLTGGRSPFLISDVTPHELRVPLDPDKINHANGASGTANLIVAVHDLAAATARYTIILGMAPVGQTQNNTQQSVTFGLDGHTITLAQPLTDDSPLADHRARFGEVPYELQLRTTQGDRAGLLDLPLAHHARLTLVTR